MSSEQEISDTPQAQCSIQEVAPERNIVDVVDDVIETDSESKGFEEEVSKPQLDDEDSSEVEKNNEHLPSDGRADQVTPKPNRELKSILALSKEAKLDTNIGHKRKSVEPGGKQPEKCESTMKRRNSTGSNSDSHKADKKLIKVQNPDLHGKQQKLCDIESPCSISDNEDSKETKEKDGFNCKINKRKRDSLPDLSIGGAADEHGKRSRKSSNNLIITMNNKKKDPFCWRCHHEGAAVFCETCPRSFHQKCLKQSVSQPNHWLCPECVTILKAENLKQRSSAMRDMSLEHLCGLLKFALKRMLQVSGCEPFIHPVSESDFPEYKNYIVQPMDLTCLEKNIKDNIYGSTQAFEADAKWILHNSIIFNSYQSKLTSIAKSMIKICKQEMSEIENCASCYLNANTKKKTWFVEVCPKPHLLVWAKLKGFPYWPAKAMRTNSQGFVDVRFFGAHDRAWVPFKECFLYSMKDPNSSKVKRNDINESVKELNIHIKNLKEVYEEFRFAPYRVIFEPDEELKHLQYMLPKYDPDAKVQPKLTRKANKHSTNGTTSPSDLETDSEKSQSDSDTNETKSTNTRKKEKNLSSSGTEDEEIKTDIGIDQYTKRVLNTPKLEDAENEESNLNKNDSDESKSSENSEHFCSVLGDSSAFVNNPTVRGGKVRMRGGYTNTSGKIKIIPKLVSPENETKKRPSSDELEIPSKISRRNSDQSIKSDSSRLSNISDKINKVDISENMEISLGNDTTGSLSISENISPTNELSQADSPDIMHEMKRKPVVQVNIGANENAEFTISPHSKSSIADRLMKKLTEPVEDDIIEANKIEAVKKQISRDLEDVPEKCLSSENQNITETDLLLEKFKNKGLTVLEKITELSPDIEIFETSTESEKNNTTEPKSSTKLNTESSQQDKVDNKPSDKLQLASKKIENSATEESACSTNHEENSNDSLEISSSDDESPESSDTVSKKEGEISPNSSCNKSDISLLSHEEKIECYKKSNQIISPSVQSKVLKENSSNHSSSGSKNLDDADDASDQIMTKETDNPDKILKNKKIVETSTSNEEIAMIIEKTQNQIETQNTQPARLQECKKRKRRSGSDEVEEVNPLQKKLVKVVNIDDIKNKNLENITSDTSDNKKDTTNEKSILENRLNTGKIAKVLGQNGSVEEEQTNDTSHSLEHPCIAGSDLSSIVVKSEPSSDDEPSDNEYMELKRKYLSALNLNESEKISDKPKQSEIRTRSKTEEKKFKVVDNLSKVIDDVATHYSAEHANEEITLRGAANTTKRKEIFIKPLSKMQMPKQRARKSFPMPIPVVKNVYPAMKKDTSKVSKSIPTSISAAPLRNTASNVPIPPETLGNNTSNIMFLASTPAITNSITILPPNQPITYTANVGNPMLTMVQHPIGTALNNVYIQPTNLTTPPVTTSSSVVNQTETTENTESQNYIPQSGAPSKTLSTTTTTNKPSTTNCNDNSTSSLGNIIPSLAPLSASTTTSGGNESNAEVSTRSNDLMDELQTLSSFVPETLTKAISEIMCRAPPKLKPRPPGPLSAQFDEGLPSAAGTVTSRVNSISHRLGDYFRGMLVELLQEMGGSSNPDAEITKLRLENEELKHKHAEEILEIKKNISSILKDIQKSLADERNRLIDETRSACEAECLKRVEEAKSKQWCANCSKEAQFYCCWNTSYCDYPCQQKHWPKHMSKCTQNIQNTQQLQTASTTTVAKSQTQPLVLRQTTAPKGFTKALIAKPTKVFVNRSGNSKGSFNVVRTTSGSHITLVEATPGNYELLGNGGPISIGGKFITSMGKIKSGNVISVTSPSSSGSTIVTGSGQKAIVIAQSKQQAHAPPKPTTTIVSDDECD